MDLWRRRIPVLLMIVLIRQSHEIAMEAWANGEVKVRRGERKSDVETPRFRFPRFRLFVLDITVFNYQNARNIRLAHPSFLKIQNYTATYTNIHHVHQPFASLLTHHAALHHLT